MRPIEHEISASLAILATIPVTILGAILGGSGTARAAYDGSDLTTAPANAPGIQFVHTAPAANTTTNWTTIDHPLTNGKPNAILIVTSNWNPGGMGGTYNSHPIGVGYDGSKWAIFNQDYAAVPADVAFNVYVYGNYHVYQPLLIR